MRVRKISRNPDSNKNYFVVDACFLANKYIPPSRAPNASEKDRIQKCLGWWKEIEMQLRRGRARVYVPDICVAESFKTLAKKYYKEGWFRNAVELNNARNRLRKDIVTDTRTLRGSKRVIRYHDIPTSRDIIIAVDRFYEAFAKYGKDVSLPDLIILATAKYLVDFYDIPKEFLHIVTLDRQLWEGSKVIQELPNAYDPTKAADARDRVFQ